MVGGVRGQEVMQQNLFTGFTNIIVGTNEVCEIINLSGNAVVKPIDYDIPQQILDLPDVWTDEYVWQMGGGYTRYTNERVSAFSAIFNSTKTIALTTAHAPQKPTIFGPCKIVVSQPWPEYNDNNGNAYGFIVPRSDIFRAEFITYRILQKQGYSPSISPQSLASNTNFVSGLTQTILSTSNSYGLASRTELIQALAESRADGVNSVLNNPNQWTLYTTNQISAMAIGDLVLTRTNNGSFVLNYDIEQSEDLVNWYPYQGFAMPLTNLPTNKAFVRIKAKQ